MASDVGFFSKKVNLRSRADMVDFLRDHYRYDGGYAHPVKIHDLGLDSRQDDLAYDMLGSDYWDELGFVIDQYTDDWGGYRTICSAGRSSGYLVFHESEYRYTEHKSRCTACGQLNFRAVLTDNDIRTASGLSTDSIYWPLAKQLVECLRPYAKRNLDAAMLEEVFQRDDVSKLYCAHQFEHPLSRWQAFEMSEALHKLLAKEPDLSNVCGRCGKHARTNLKHGVRELRIGQAIGDPNADFDDRSEWDMSSLRERVKLVQQFDRACDGVRAAFIDLLENHELDKAA